MIKILHGTSEEMLKDLYECYRVSSNAGRDYRLVSGVAFYAVSKRRQFVIRPKSAEEYEVFAR